MSIFFHSLIQTLEHFGWSLWIVGAVFVCVKGYRDAEAER
jgi:hypothetical protein